MIEIYEGRIGSGKTLSAVLRILDYLRAGCYVVTNIELKIPEISKRLGFDVSQLLIDCNGRETDFYRITPPGEPGKQTLVVLDEAQIYLSSRSFKSTPAELIHFLAQSRKVFVDIIFITQHFKNIECMISRLTEYLWVFKDLSKYQIFFFRLPRFLLQIQYSAIDRVKIQHSFRTYSTSDFILYNSFSLIRTFPMAERKNLKISKNWRAYKMPLIICLCLLVGWGVYRWAPKSPSPAGFVAPASGSVQKKSDLENFFFPCDFYLDSTGLFIDGQSIPVQIGGHTVLGQLKEVNLYSATFHRAGQRVVYMSGKLIPQKKEKIS